LDRRWPGSRHRKPAKAPLVSLVCPAQWQLAQAPRVRLVCPTHKQAAQALKAGQTEHQVAAAPVGAPSA